MKTQYEHYKQVQADSEVYCRDLRVVKLDEPEDEPKLARYLLRSKGLRRGYSWFEVVVLHHGHLLVHGDIDAIVFGICGGYTRARQVLYWMANAEPDYAGEKACIGGGRKVAYEFEPEVAKWYVREWWMKRGDVDEEAGDLLIGAIEDGQHAFIEQIYQTDGLEPCDDANAGEVVSRAVIAAQAALRALIRELEAIDFRMESKNWFRRAA